jgi:hypothetical protein
MDAPRLPRIAPIMAIGLPALSLRTPNEES